MTTVGDRACLVKTCVCLRNATHCNPAMQTIAKALTDASHTLTFTIVISQDIASAAKFQ